MDLYDRGTELDAHDVPDVASNADLQTDNTIQCAPLNKAMFKVAIPGYAIQSPRNRFFISFCVQNTHGYKATIPVLASGYTIQSDTIFTRKRRGFSKVRLIIWIIISFTQLHIVIGRFNPLS